MAEELPELDKLGRLSVDIDARLTSLWLIVTEPGSVLADAMQDKKVADAVGAAIRAAYGWGYHHARQDIGAGRLSPLPARHEGEA